MKYKIGDKVKVRNDLKVQRYGDQIFVKRMEKYKGKIVTISDELPGFYHIKEDKNENWNWAEQMSEKNIVLVSEHKAPLGWDCIWKQEVERTIDNNKRVKAVEKLFEVRE